MTWILRCILAGDPWNLCHRADIVKRIVYHAIEHSRFAFALFSKGNVYSRPGDSMQVRADAIFVAMKNTVD